MTLKQFLKPNWKKIVLLIILLLVLPERIENQITFLGGVTIIKSFFEVSAPQTDLFFAAIMLIIAYLLSCFLVWFYERYVNKFITGEGEEEVIPEGE